MSVNNLFKSGAKLQWSPDSDEVNASPGALLRADNLVPDETDHLTLRRGSSVTFPTTDAAAGDQSVDSIYCAEIDGTVVRMHGSVEPTANGQGVYEANVFRDGATVGETFLGTGDVVFCDDAYQIFFARGSSKYKFGKDKAGNWVTNPWGIDAPTEIGRITPAYAGRG